MKISYLRRKSSGDGDRGVCGVLGVCNERFGVLSPGLCEAECGLGLARVRAPTFNIPTLAPTAPDTWAVDKKGNKETVIGKASGKP